jgi:hypothetical protein
MKLNKTPTRTLILGAALALAAAAPMLALAQPASALPDEPTHGSIAVNKQASESDLAKLATFGQTQAIDAATRHTPGKVTETELTVENKFLVWEVKLVANNGTVSELYIDAGNGEVLAMEQEDEDDESEGNESEDDGDNEGKEENERG